MEGKYLKILIIWLTVLMTVRMAGTAENWWNKEWKYRLPVRINFGMTETENILITTRIARDILQKKIGEVDINSFRLIDQNGTEIPCAVRIDASGDCFVIFRNSGKTGILETKNYYVYLDSKSNGPKEKKVYETLSDVPDIVPGMNLISNGDFSAVDENGFPKGWYKYDGDAGKRYEWTDEDREKVKVVNVDDKKCLQLKDKASVVCFIERLKEGQSCKLSLMGKVEQGATILATVWFRRAKLDWFRNGIGNYKIQGSIGTPGGWTYAEFPTFVYRDKDGNMRYNNRYLLPETETAFIDIRNYNPPEGASVYITDVRFELVGETSEMKITVGDIETCQ